MSAIISGIGGYLPEKILTNEDMTSFVETNNEWIVSRTGIKKRHIVKEGETTSDMSSRALESALSHANLAPEKLDGIIVATTTPDLIMPSTAVLTQKKIGATSNCFAFDIQAACSGFLYALELGFSMMNSGNFENIAIIGADSMSKVVNWKDRSTCVLFGDGAGAFILNRTSKKDKGLICSKIYSDPELSDILKVKGGISQGYLNAKLEMDGPTVFKNAVEKLSSSMKEVLKSANLSIDDIDLIIPHQANLRITNSVSYTLGALKNKVLSTISEHANTSAASIPLALNTKRDLVKSGNMNLMFAAIGSGMTWGACIVKT